MEKLIIATVALFASTSVSFILSTLFYHIAINRTPSFHLTLRGDMLGEISLILIPVTFIFLLLTASLSAMVAIRFFVRKLRR